MTIIETKVSDPDEDILFYRLGDKWEWAHPVGRRISEADIAAMRKSDQRTPVRMAAKRAIAGSMVKEKMRSIPPSGSSRENSMLQRIAGLMDKMVVVPFYHVEVVTPLPAGVTLEKMQRAQRILKGEKP